MIPRGTEIPQDRKPISADLEAGEAGLDPQWWIAEMRSIGVEVVAIDGALYTGYINRTDQDRLDFLVGMMRADDAYIGRVIDALEAEADRDDEADIEPEVDCKTSQPDDGLPHRPPKGQLSEDDRLAIRETISAAHDCHDNAIDEILSLCQALHFVGEAIGGVEQNAIAGLARAIESNAEVAQGKLHCITDKLRPVARKHGAIEEIPKRDSEAE